MITRTGTTGTNPAHRPAAPAPKPAAPTVNVTRTAVGPAADSWEGVGVNRLPPDVEGTPTGTPAQLAVGDKQIADLKPQLNRVYISPLILDLQQPGWAQAHPLLAAKANSDLATVKHLVSEATQNGAHVDLNLWDLDKGFKTTPEEMKQTTDRFAGLVKDLKAQTPNYKPGQFHVSVQNEPNRTKLAPPQIVSFYQDLDSSLKTAGVRKDVKVIAGHLTEGDQSAKWISAIVPKLGGVVDGFSFHVYARSGETPEHLEGRLTNLKKEVFAAMPAGVPKPELLLTEYGVRGVKSPADPADSPGEVKVNGKMVPLRDTPVGAFREAQLVLAATRAGFSGATRWGASPGGTTAWTMTGTAAEGYQKKPAYFLTQLFTSAVPAGWKPEQASASVAGESIATWRAPTGNGAAAVVANSKPTAQALNLGGFAPGKPVQILSWNSHGGGLLLSQQVVADAQGRVRVNVNPGAVTAATTQLTKPT